MAADLTHNFGTSGLSDALVILGAAGIVIPAFARFRVSPVIGFILVGALVGPAGLGALAANNQWLTYVTITSPDAIAPFAEFGIILLLFSIGLELSFPRLWSMRRLVFGVGATELIGGAALIGCGMLLAGYAWTGALALGLALAMSSTAVVLPLVGTTSAVGRSALAMLLFEDVALVPIIFVLGILGPYGGDTSDVLDILWKSTLAIAGILIAGRFFLPRLFAQAARAKSPELFLSASLIVAIVAALITSAVGLSPYAGALLAGILIAETEYHGEVEAMTAPFRGLGLGVFLITVGMSLDVVLIAANWQLLLLALLGVMVVKTLVTASLLRLSGASKSVSAEAGVLMASPSETTLIVLGAAGTAGLIASDTAAFWQIVTALGLTITPLLARIGRDLGRRVTKLDGASGGSGALPSRDEPRAVIIGFGRVGKLVADMLVVHKKAYLAVESDIDAVNQAIKDGYHVTFGDAGRGEFIDKLNLGHASALILTMDDPVLSMRLVKKVRAYCPDLTIVARARDATHAAELYRAGVTDAVPETLESSLQLSEAVLVDLGMAMGPVIASIHEKRAEMRQQIMDMGELEREPNIRRTRIEQVGAEPG